MEEVKQQQTDAEQMRAEFFAWVENQGCDSDGAWSAWQACWNRFAHLARENEVLAAQRDQARAQKDFCFKWLSGITNLLSPDDVKFGGKVYRFENPYANETLRELSARIMAIPDKLKAVQDDAAIRQHSERKG